MKKKIKEYKGESIEDCLRYQRHLKKVFKARVEKAYLYAEELNNKKTSSECHFEAKVKAWGIKYEPQYLIITGSGKYMIADYYLPDYHLVVEIDGGIHKKPDVWANDRFKEDLLRANGFTNILRIKNEDIIFFTSDWLGQSLPKSE